ncbi:MAG: M56 family metallopeptidase [Eubacteriales bacterium]|nr:M56 family metallopeptidase [Eubacteriales bacterium]
METMLKTLLQLSGTMTVVSVCVLLLLPLLGRYIQSRGIYRSLLILFVGFMIPFRPVAKEPVFKLSVPSLSSVVVRSDLKLGVQHAGGANVSNDRNLFTLNQIVFLVWVTGMIVVLIYHITKHIRFMKIVRRWGRDIQDGGFLECLMEEKRDLGISKDIRLLLCRPVGMPMLTGFMKPVILLPDSDLNEQECRLIIRHELIHYKHRDILGKLLMMTVLAVHWFNPLVYLLVKITAFYCEESCDTETMKDCSLDMRMYYSETIIRTIRRQTNQRTMLSTNFYGGKNDMKRRILSIMNMNSKRFGAIAIGCVLLLMLSTGMFFTFGIKDVQADTDGKSEDYRIIAEMAEIDRNTSVSDYNRKLNEICESNGKEFFDLLSDVSPEIGEDDPLYTFYTDTLSYSRSELFADVMGEQENSFAYCYAVKEEYGSEPVREDYYSDAEWALVEERGPELVYMVSVNYVLNYDIADTDSMTVEERDTLISEVRHELQEYLNKLSETQLLDGSLEEQLSREFRSISGKYSSAQMNIDCQIQNIEREV